MTQETLEQVAEKYSKRSTAPIFQRAHKQDFIAGAEWQSKKMYSEEEVLEVFGWILKVELIECVN